MLFHRHHHAIQVNKHVHIWFGHFAFLAGAIQCYRGVELVSATDSLHFSAIEDLVEFEVSEVFSAPMMKKPPIL